MIIKGTSTVPIKEKNETKSEAFGTFCIGRYRHGEMTNLFRKQEYAFCLKIIENVPIR